MSSRQKEIARYLEEHPNQEFTSAQLQSALGIKLNHNVTGVAPKVKALLPGVTYSLNRWKYVAVAHAFRGQGTTCEGRLQIILRGPKGSGKSLVAKLLKAVLPFVMVDEIEILIEKE